MRRSRKVLGPHILTPMRLLAPDVPIPLVSDALRETYKISLVWMQAICKGFFRAGSEVCRRVDNSVHLISWFFKREVLAGSEVMGSIVLFSLHGYRAYHSSGV
jgi:hypothetical protein